MSFSASVVYTQKARAYDISGNQWRLGNINIYIPVEYTIIIGPYGAIIKIAVKIESTKGSDIK
jgi:hypothetical protein